MLIYFIPVYLIATLAIGFWASKKIKTSGDFMLAGKSLSTSFVGVTLFATWFGSSQIMGNPSHFVGHGFSSFVTLVLSTGLCLLLVGMFYARKLYRLNIVTIGDFFQSRYNKNIDLTISIILVFSYPQWIAAQFVALGFLFNTVLGIPTEYGILLGASIVILYTYIGGMWAVSYTDMLQSIMILLGLFLLLWNILHETGGISPIVADKPQSFFSLYPEGGIDQWSVYLATLLAFVFGALPGQEIWQRVFSAKSERAAVNGVYLGAFLMVLIPTVPLLIALGGAYLHPELMTVDEGQNIIPSIVSLHAGPIVQVLFYGALISAILSTSSGALLAPSTIIGENLIRPNIPDMTDKKLLLYTRLSVIVVAVISCYFAYSDSDIVALVVASVSLLLVCLFAPLTFGLFWKKSSVSGAWSAIIAGGLTWLCCWIFETTIDATIYGTIASCLAMVIGSFVRPDNNSSKNRS